MWLFTFADKIKGSFTQSVDNSNCRIGEYTIRTEKEFSEIIWDKYPKVCPVCFWWRHQNGCDTPEDYEKGCECLIHDVEDRDKTKGEEEKRNKVLEKQSRVKALRNFAKTQSELEKKPNTIDDWQKMFKELFKSNLRHISLVDIGFHLLEEVGEVSDAMMRMYSYKGSFNGQPKWNQI